MASQHAATILPAAFSCTPLAVARQKRIPLSSRARIVTKYLPARE